MYINLSVKLRADFFKYKNIQAKPFPSDRSKDSWRRLFFSNLPITALKIKNKILWYRTTDSNP